LERLLWSRDSGEEKNRDDFHADPGRRKVLH
jgi:hypothetical protein